MCAHPRQTCCTLTWHCARWIAVCGATVTYVRGVRCYSDMRPPSVVPKMLNSFSKRNASRSSCDSADVTRRSAGPSTQGQMHLRSSGGGIKRGFGFASKPLIDSRSCKLQCTSAFEIGRLIVYGPAH